MTIGYLLHFGDYMKQLSYVQIEYVNSINKIKCLAIRNAMKYMDTPKIRLEYKIETALRPMRLG